MPVKPFSPQEAREALKKNLPDYVIEAVNQLLAEKIGSSSYITLMQDEVLDLIMELSNGEVTRDEVIKRHYLDFEGVYRDAGGKVTYDRPGFNEDYEASYCFRIRE